MVLNSNVEQILRLLEHDGSEIVWPDQPDPACRRGFHIQECIELLRTIDLMATPYEAVPCQVPSFGVPAYRVFFGGTEISALERFTSIIGSTRGIITGRCRFAHAVAYEYGRVFDPAGIIYDYSPEACQLHNFLGLCAWSIK
jgi:hypothetical protein